MENILNEFLPFCHLSENELLSLLNLPNILNFDVFSKLKFEPIIEATAHDREYHPDLNLNSDLIPTNNYFELDHNDSAHLKRSLKSDQSFLFFNIRSFFKNSEEFFHDFLPLNFALFGFTETWLSGANEIFSVLPQYTAYHQCRNNKKGGGVSLFIRNSILSQRVDRLCFSLPHLETVFISFSINGKKYVVRNFYRPPKSNLREFLESFRNIFEIIEESFRGSTICVGGDSNIDLLKLDKSPLIHEYFTLFSSYGFQQQIMHPTRVCTSATLLDHIWVRNNSCKMESGIILSHITDHFPVFVSINSTALNNTRDDTLNVEYRLKNKSCHKSFEDKIKMINWSSMLTVNDVETLYPLFENCLYSVFDECFPIGVVKRKKVDVDKPYINNYIKNLIKRKHIIQRKFYKKPITYGDEYRRIKNLVNREIDKAKTGYFESKVKQNDKNPKGMWGTLNEIAGWQNKPTSIPEIFVDELLISDSKIIPNKLNEYFSLVGKRLIDDLPSTTEDHSYFSNIFGNLGNLNFSFRTISRDELLSLIKGLNNTSSGTRTIPMDIFKKYIEIFCDVILHICNLSLRTGIFPQNLKTSTVICIHKGGDRRTMSNYRPISLLPAFSKIIEKIVCIQLNDYFMCNHLFTNDQYGFLRKSSTEGAVLELTDAILSSFSNGDFLLGVFIDLAKAFDSMDRNILFMKLSYYGFTPETIRWFQSYFSNRTQRTLVNGKSTDCYREVSWDQFCF